MAAREAPTPAPAPGERPPGGRAVAALWPVLLLLLLLLYLPPLPLLLLLLPLLPLLLGGSLPPGILSRELKLPRLLLLLLLLLKRGDKEGEEAAAPAQAGLGEEPSGGRMPHCRAMEAAVCTLSPAATAAAAAVRQHCY